MSAYRERLLGLLGSDDPFEVLAKTPRRVDELLAAIGAAGMERPHQPGKWTARQIVGHLADVEQGSGFRVRQIVTGADDGKIQAFDQDLWAKPYAGLDTRAAARAFAALRAWNLEYYRSLTAADRDKVGLHPERGPESAETTIRMIAGHDRNHLAQLERIAGLGRS